MNTAELNSLSSPFFLGCEVNVCCVVFKWLFYSKFLSPWHLTLSIFGAVWGCLPVSATFECLYDNTEPSIHPLLILGGLDELEKACHVCWRFRVHYNYTWPENCVKPVHWQKKRIQMYTYRLRPISNLDEILSWLWALHDKSNSLKRVSLWKAAIESVYLY